MTEEERLSILEWVEKKIVEWDKNKSGLNPIIHHKFTFGINITDNEVPIAIWRIKKRLIEREGLHECRQDQAFKDIILIIPNGGILHPHTDPTGVIDDAIHCRFNVFVKVPESLDTYYAGYLVEAKNRHYVMCRSGLDMHWSSENISENRISLSFGYLIPRKRLAELYQIPAGTVKMKYSMMPSIRFNTYISQFFMSFKIGY